MPTTEEQLLANAILHYQPFLLATAIRRALKVAGEYVPEEEEELLQDYVARINIDMVPDGFRYVSRDGVLLLGLGPLELFEQDGIAQLLTKCAVWYGTEALAGAVAGATVEVYDVLGHRVLTTAADATGQAQLVLPAGLASGMYVVRSGAKAVRLVVE